MLNLWIIHASLRVSRQHGMQGSLLGRPCMTAHTFHGHGHRRLKTNQLSSTGRLLEDNH